MYVQKMITIKLTVTFKIFATGIGTVLLVSHRLYVTTLKISRSNFVWFFFYRELNFFCCLEPFPFHYPLELQK